VALEKGFYVQEGLDVKVAGIFKAGPELMSSFFAGALDAGYVGVALATTAVPNKTARVTVLAQANSECSALGCADSKQDRSGFCKCARTRAWWPRWGWARIEAGSRGGISR
jgi:ABC-type nitrate/sulfonate/bicarbonate transport system substrate-binding protein